MNAPSDIEEVDGLHAGFSIGSTIFFQREFVWMIDSANGLIYQVGTTDSANINGVIAGVFLSQPSCRPNF